MLSPEGGLHDVLFHPLDKILHRPADDDFVHGFSLGRFPTADGQTVDLRVLRQKWDANFNVGHPKLFAEHAVYQALAYRRTPNLNVQWRQAGRCPLPKATGCAR